jgi:hypothetical protein
MVPRYMNSRFGVLWKHPPSVNGQERLASADVMYRS